MGFKPIKTRQTFVLSIERRWPFVGRTEFDVDVDNEVLIDQNII
jgi:hypothetical protein